MKFFTSRCANFVSFILVSALANSAFGDSIVDTGTVSVMQASSSEILGGTSTFTLDASNIPDLELLANFSIVDAGVEVRVNGTPLFPPFDDVSQFSQDVVFVDTGVTEGTGNIESPFLQNDNELPRLTINSTSDETTFGGGATLAASSPIAYTPNFEVQDFSSLLIAGENNIEFYVLKDDGMASLQGDYTVSLKSDRAEASEHTASGLVLLAVMAALLRRYRRI